MGRPALHGETLVVDIDGTLMVWTDGHLSCDNKEYVKEAKLASKFEVPVDLTIIGPTIPAGLDDPNEPIRALAAMIYVSPGRATILQAPITVTDILPFNEEEIVLEELEEFIKEEKMEIPNV
jgi:hypothetical protein